MTTREHSGPVISPLPTKPTETQQLPASNDRHAIPALARITTWLPTWQRCPATVTYLLVLVTTYWITMCLLPRDQALHLLLSVSTNLHNLTQHPLRALLGSALFPATPLLSTSGILTLGVGIGCCMGLIERTRGTWRALATFAAGHTLATLLTVPVVLLGISTHRYDPAELDGLDFGVSYGAVATMAAMTSHLPRPLRPLWLASGVGYLLSTASWYGALPDFTTVGHMLAVGIGLAAARLLRLNRPPTTV
ncbi:rhomboid-like protein [Kitasatospora herbaricolor]|uniref:rhomboid-like protein n=1 Tax=Kitasatospora herbaricolor TaxID=68217 RepID=UPI0036DBB493